MREKRIFNILVFLANWLHKRAILEKRSAFLHFVFKNYLYINLSKTWETLNITNVFLAEFALKIKHSKIIKLTEVDEMLQIEFERIRTTKRKLIRFKKERFAFDTSNTGKFGIIPIINDKRAED